MTKVELVVVVKVGLRAFIEIVVRVLYLSVCLVVVAGLVGVVVVMLVVVVEYWW